MRIISFNSHNMYYGKEVCRRGLSELCSTTPSCLVTRPKDELLADWRRAGHSRDHAADRQAEEVRLALAGTVYEGRPRGCA